MTGGENRRKSILKALRKKRIDHMVYRYYYEDPEHGFYDNLHQYSKKQNPLQLPHVFCENEK